MMGLMLSMTGFSQFYYGMHHPFGKNRVQHEAFDWQKYEFRDFTVFFYGEGKNLAIYTARNAEEMINEVERFFDYPVKKERLQFVVYQKLEHFRQSNVGIPETDESNVGGTTQIAGNKIFIYFDGDLNKMRTQIRKGISDVLIAQMLFGDNWREMIKNTTLLSFPQWYIEGLTSYAANPWDVEADDRLRDLVLRGRYQNFSRLKGIDAEVAGRSLWYYIGETYGTSVIPNIIYMARVSRNVENGFMFVLGISMSTLLDDAQRYFIHRYEGDITGTQEFAEFVPVRTRKKLDYSEVKLSDDGRYLAYVSNNLGKTKVWIYDTEEDKRRGRLRQGHRLDRIYDLSYPILDWNEATDRLVVITEKKGSIWMYQIDPEKGLENKSEILRLEKVLEMDISSDGKQILFSAINKGQTDIYLYSVAANSHKQLTKDIYDDRYPSFWGSDKVMFSSNRLNDTVDLARDYLEYAPGGFYDLFSLELNGESEISMPLTHTPDANETYAYETGSDAFVYLGDKSGIQNRYRGFLDSSIVSIDTTITYRYFTETEPLTGFPRNLREMDYLLQEKASVDLTYFDGRYRFQKLNEADRATFESPRSKFRQLDAPLDDSQQPAETAPSDTNDIIFIREKVFEQAPKGSVADDGLIDILNYEFDEESLSDADELPPEESPAMPLDTIKTKRADPFAIPEQRNYDLAFAATELTTQMDFGYATDIYQPFNGGPFVMPGMGAYIKVGMLDVFEDYKLEGGVRASFTGTGSEFFLSLDNRSKRIDRKYIFVRKSLIDQNQAAPIFRTYMYQGMGIFRYPFDEVHAFQLTTIGRYEKLVTQAIEQQTLEEPDVFNYWVGVKGEYIFDNTLFKSLNILNGTRLKVFGEHYREAIDPTTDFTVVGLDARNYIPIHRDLIWANRLAASSSFGTRKLVYYLGSVDNWVVLSNREQFDRTTNIANDQGYYYQTIATNMRGFIQNARNGNNFAAFNSELRWPVVKYFMQKPVKSEFLSNLQLIGFADVGTAWNGVNPYSDDNAFNNIEEDNGSVTVIYKNQSDPIIGGLGWGLRTKVWGYFVRFDYAWGIENALFLEPVTYLSIGLDF